MTWIILIILGYYFMVKLNKTCKKETLLIVLGSGGHTTEMLFIFKKFNF
jgi:hypothetical protein